MLILVGSVPKVALSFLLGSHSNSEVLLILKNEEPEYLARLSLLRLRFREQKFYQTGPTYMYIHTTYMYVRPDGHYVRGYNNART